MNKKLNGKLAVIVSDNNNYDNYRNKLLRITHVAYNRTEHPGYDEGMEGQALCDFKVEKTRENLPFSLYEYEFQLA